ESIHTIPNCYIRRFLGPGTETSRKTTGAFCCLGLCVTSVPPHRIVGNTHSPGGVETPITNHVYRTSRANGESEDYPSK
ncbi:hypothetical protein RSAG8_09021, partial [Rhizoctonia solani AG-8 WAC10335]